MTEGPKRAMVAGEIAAAMKRTNDIACRAVAEQNADMLADVYTSEARILPPGHAAVSGRESIIPFWAAVMESGLTALTLTTVDVIPGGDYLTEVGEAQLTLGTEQAAVKYVVLWKQEDGAWKWHVDIWNSNA